MTVKTRQHSAPILVPNDFGSARPLDLVAKATTDSFSEAEVQELVHRYPETLPISEIDPIFAGAVSICRELITPAGAIDNLLMTPTGLPVLVECKLWRNPQGRREVIGQILDYAKVLAKWSSADMQREVARNLKRSDNALLHLVRVAEPTLNETTFNDQLTANLRRGRFLLLIIGDGIREGVEAIVDYLQAHAGLHFSFGLVEMPIYTVPGGARLVAPRITAKTFVVAREVVIVPEGYKLQEDGVEAQTSEVDPERVILGDAQSQFWTDFLKTLKLDDPEQIPPKAARSGFTTLKLPAPGGSSWIVIYRDMKQDCVGIYLSGNRNSAGEYAMQRVADDWTEVGQQLGGTSVLTDVEGRPRISDTLKNASLASEEGRREAFSWLSERVNTYVNVLRPRVRAAVSDYVSQQDS